LILHADAQNLHLSAIMHFSLKTKINGETIRVDDFRSRIIQSEDSRQPNLICRLRYLHRTIWSRMTLFSSPIRASPVPPFSSPVFPLLFFFFFGSFFFAIAWKPVRTSSGTGMSECCSLSSRVRWRRWGRSFYTRRFRLEFRTCYPWLCRSSNVDTFWNADPSLKIIIKSNR